MVMHLPPLSACSIIFSLFQGPERVLHPSFPGCGSLLGPALRAKHPELESASFRLGAPASTCRLSFWLAGLLVGNTWTFLFRMAPRPCHGGVVHVACGGHSG